MARWRSRRDADAEDDGGYAATARCGASHALLEARPGNIAALMATYWDRAEPVIVSGAWLARVDWKVETFRATAQSVFPMVAVERSIEKDGLGDNDAMLKSR